MIRWTRIVFSFDCSLVLLSLKGKERWSRCPPLSSLPFQSLRLAFTFLEPRPSHPRALEKGNMPPLPRSIIDPDIYQGGLPLRRGNPLHVGGNSVFLGFLVAPPHSPLGILFRRIRAKLSCCAHWRSAPPLLRDAPLLVPPSFIFDIESLPFSYLYDFDAFEQEFSMTC